MSRLHVADGVRLPLDWITLASVVYGARGSGKTTLGAVAAEESTKAGQRFCAIDLKGDWYGLKSSADGKAEGIPAVIFGGDHADVPLEPDAGKEVASIVAELEQSVILDFELMSKGKQLRFLGAFFEQLYHVNRQTLLLFLDEAQRYAPQKPMSPEATICLGAVEDLVKLGRKHGIGVVLFTQRGSGLNKEVSELCDMLIAFRTPGPLDQDRIKDWLDANTAKAQRDEVMGQLAGLETGTAVFASGHPGLKVFHVGQVRERETFDSSATPRIGQRKKEPKRLAKPDLAALTARMTVAIERAKQEDPKELRRRIQELERAARSQKPQLAAAPVTKVQEVVKRVEVPVLKDAQLKRLEGVSTKLVQFGERVVVLGENVVAVGGEITASLTKLQQSGNGGSRPVPAPAPRPLSRPIAPPRTKVRQVQRSIEADAGDAPPSGALQRVLDALAELEALGVAEPPRVQVAFLAGYTNLNSKGFVNAIGAARSRGLIEYPREGQITLTDDGRGLASAPNVPRTSAELQNRLLRLLGGASERLLGPLIEVYPDPVDRQELAAAAGYGNLNSKGFVNAIGRLRSLGFIDYPTHGQVAAQPVLFLEGAR